MGNLPEFLIIGVTRCGTSSLWKNLKQHPQIKSPSPKEVHFWSDDTVYNRGIEWYKSIFPEVEKNTLCFEASPGYFKFSISAKRILNELPDCKFIVLLRNPVDRACSLYARWKPRRKNKRWDSHDMMVGKSLHSYVTTGIYVEFLRGWFDYFARDRFLIIKSEDYFSDEKKIIAQCFDWLGVEPIDIGKSLFYDRKGNMRKWFPYKIEVPDDVKEYLRKFYEPYNQELYKLLGRDFGWQ